MIDGKTCRKCGSVLERRPSMFYWRGRFFHGLVCVPCNALWDDPTDSFERHVSEQARAGASEGTNE
jgi:ribosomal protein L40E